LDVYECCEAACPPELHTSSRPGIGTVGAVVLVVHDKQRLWELCNPSYANRYYIRDRCASAG